MTFHSQSNLHSTQILLHPSIAQNTYMSAPQVVVRLRPGSDGDATHVPPPGLYTRIDPPVLYLEKLGQQWMASRGEARPGVSYVLEKLPNGYTLWARPRPSDAKHFDKYLYGHPEKKKFDSPNRYYPHFKYLMDNNGSSTGCPCTVCLSHVGVLPSRSSSSSSRIRSTNAPSSRLPVSKPAPTALPSSTTVPLSSIQPKGHPKTTNAGTNTNLVEEEGTPDVYRVLLDKLRWHRKIDEAIEEPQSPDWRAEQESLPEVLRSLRDQQQWIPRVGDIVLYIRHLPEGTEIIRHNSTQDLQLHDEISGEYSGPPPWEAGLVAQVPRELPAINQVKNQNQDTSIIYSGLRVEPIAGPKSSDDSLPKKYKYVALRQTRPFILWSELLHHVRPEEWHPSIRNALTLMSTLSLMGKYRFCGTWPEATIYCHGMYIGSELIVVGDVVRLLPTVQSKHNICTDIMVIKSIRLKWSRLDSLINDNEDDGNEAPYTSEIWVYGSAYSNDPKRPGGQEMCDQAKVPSEAAAGYSSWYPLHPATMQLAVPFCRILGRLFEREAMTNFLNLSPHDEPALDSGREGLEKARNHSRQHDPRITAQPDANWFWGDNRAEALDIHSINGVDVTTYNQERNIKGLRKEAKVINEMPSNRASTFTGFKGINLRRFAAPDISSLPARTRTPQVSSSDKDATGWANNGNAQNLGKKRTSAVRVSRDEEDIWQFSKVIKNDLGSSGNKKAMVSVVID